MERKDQSIKRIIEKIDKENSQDDQHTTIARATFFSNIFSGSTILSSFELVKGYSPSLLGIPTKVISQEILDAHKEQVATRAIQRLLKARSPNTPTAHMLPQGRKIYVFMKPSRGTAVWTEAEVIDPRDHFVVARRSRHGRPMKVAYEDIRLVPEHPLAIEPMQDALEDALGYKKDV